MKKILLILGTSLMFYSGANAQTIYSESFTGTTVPTGWTGPASFTLTANNKLIITMNDSVGPQQLPLVASPAANWAAFQYAFPTPVNMAAGCKCITFDIDNSANNQSITYAVQAQDMNHNGTNNKYTDQTNVTVAANYVGSVTINFTGKFQNYYGYPAAGGLIDSTHIAQINFQPLGGGLPADPWNKKFKGNFSMDNLTVSGIAATGTNAAAANIASTKLYPNPTSDMAKVELNLKSNASVKVTLSDAMGKEVMTITEGTFTTLTKEFSVSNLKAGVYTVNYTINGEAAKAELLMVK